MAKHISNGRLLKKLAAYFAQNRRVRKGFLRDHGAQIKALGITIDHNRMVLDPAGKLLQYQPPVQKPAPEPVADPTRIADEPKFSQEDGPSRFAPSPENAVGSEEPKRKPAKALDDTGKSEVDKPKKGKPFGKKSSGKTSKGKSDDAK